ncbi:MAG: efflux RND transporter permease subunit [Wenzhouxiangellaceae bacterium]
MSWISQALGRRRLILSTVLLLSLAGLAAWFSMIRQEDPAFPYRYGFVMVQFPGADVEMVERLVADPLEEELTQVEQVDDLTTTIRAGFAFILVAMKQTVYDTDTAWDRIRVAVDRAATNFPEETLPPVVDDRQIDAATVVLAVTGSSDVVELQQAAETLRKRLFSLNDIARIRIYGESGEQLTIAIDDQKLRELNLSPDELAAQLQARNQIVPGGYVQNAGRQVILRPLSEYRSVAEVAATPILLDNGTAIPLSTIADVRLEVREPPAETAWMGQQRAVVLAVIAQRDAVNSVTFGTRIRERIEQLRPEFAPVQINEMFFQPERVAERLYELGQSLLLGVSIVAVILLLVMGWRLGLVVAALVPLVTLAALALFSVGGGVLHQMAVAGMVIALGLLVDNAIVMAENIQWHLDRGASAVEAAVMSVRELAGPLGAATGTTVAVFVPMLASSGDTADFTRAVPAMITLMLVTSYVFAIFVTPPLGEKLLKARLGSGGASGRLSDFGLRLGDFAAHHPLRVILIAALVVVINIFLSSFVGRDFFPDTDRNQLVVDVYFPEGTAIGVTTDFTLDVAAQLERMESVQRVFAYTGNSGPRFYYNLNETPRAPHIGRLAIETRSVSDIDALVEWVREQSRLHWPQADVVPRRLAQGPPQPAPVEIRLAGSNWQDLAAATDQLVRQLRQIPGTIDVRHNLGVGLPTLYYQIDDVQAGVTGLDRQRVAQALARQSQGLRIGTYRAMDDPVPILLRSPEGEWFPLAELDAVNAWSRQDQALPLAQVSHSELRWQPAVRHHFNLQPAVTVYSELQGGQTYAAVFEALYERLENEPLPAGIELIEGGAQESSGDANAALFHTLPLGIILLLFFLLLQFNSFRRVTIILISVPLAVAGVVPGLLLTGYPFGFMAMLGVIALAGIVVNNAIVLIDVIDHHLNQGQRVEAAVVAAVQRRIRPILLTTATTVAGLLPLTFTRSTLWPPMAWSIISGLVASTLLTLIVVPALMKLTLRQR